MKDDDDENGDGDEAAAAGERLRLHVAELYARMYVCLYGQRSNLNGIVIENYWLLVYLPVPARPPYGRNRKWTSLIFRARLRRVTLFVDGYFGRQSLNWQCQDG